MTGTTSYSWDFENRLTQVTLSGTSGTVTFKYDPFGRRIYKQSPNATSIFVYDGDALVETVNSSGGGVARYTQGQNIDEPLAMERGSTVDYYEADGVGAVTSLTAANGSVAQSYAYDSFGNTTNSSGSLTNFYRYAGREFDTETDLYYNRARYYDGNTGRFISEDPIQFLGSADFYTYANNGPVRYIDPSGLETEVILWNPAGYGESSFGHVSVEINGTSYSWGPAPGSNPLNKCCRAGVMNVQPAQKFVNTNTKFRSGLGYVLNLTASQETAFANFLKNFKGNYNLVDRNCGNPVLAGLRALGFNLVLPEGPAMGLDPMPIMPNDLDYALGHTNGLVTGWVPYPQQSSSTK
jgi:RHS repeat-associated protein